MKQFLFILFVTCFIFFACSPGKKASSSTIKQGITGRITRERGNRMPMVDGPRGAAGGILTTVFVYMPTNISQVTRIGTSPIYTAINTTLVASVNTDSTGAFTLALPPGTYSVFIKREKQFYANLFDSNNNIALFTVEAGKLTKVNLTVNSSATY